MEFYFDDKKVLWKKDESGEYYFSQKKLDWIKSKIVMILPIYDYDYKISEEEAKKIIDNYKKSGIKEDAVCPYRYFLSDADNVYAADADGKSFIVLKDKTLKPLEGGISCMWGGIDESQIDPYL